MLFHLHCTYLSKGVAEHVALLHATEFLVPRNCTLQAVNGGTATTISSVEGRTREFQFEMRTAKQIISDAVGHSRNGTCTAHFDIIAN